ncbi:hypothetical protein M758_10G091400 [Ceratodon purpureus]|uniref:Uncharacterized protein n=1 Tax=Ceratodon purpureus TaxID=3225 RepID=A0A8T0GNF2_CERPU|nr:hypothetical protein KC19_10G093000 [Ceratodon purpureus]KAG0603405.1 hypothetical protein M758_10G091400 [Ceratodon purpureus]
MIAKKAFPCRVDISAENRCGTALLLSRLVWCSISGDNGRCIRTKHPHGQNTSACVNRSAWEPCQENGDQETENGEGSERGREREREGPVRRGSGVHERSGEGSKGLKAGSPSIATSSTEP